ncbi:hypothetical protein C4D60_Mb02t07980 [Musa balbisiana]|uniref:Pentacotripeptide-repeat region of PRORP domain-containing protein n=1 Tax=Musa balbisiana TaxID=52838 RepID=A0A4S8I945_MUSBA|nr:hypothetical protein C4D60_Mb02t07980 [Musa balbisiana]
MQEYQIAPNTASCNLVLKAMFQARESETAEKLVDRCVTAGKLDTLATIIEKCKTTDQNKALCPSWNLCNYIADVALQEDHNKLVYFSLEFLARWIARGENARPPVLLSADEGLVVSAVGTSGRTYNSTLLDVAWSILQRSLHQKRAPSPETYLAKIYAHASLGQLQCAFATLNEFETVYENSEVDQELFSPFTSIYPLVIACCKNGFSTLDSAWPQPISNRIPCLYMWHTFHKTIIIIYYVLLVYIQLENLSRAHPLYKSVAAFNCVILGCANIWDLDLAYETFEAISEKIGTTPDVHSYNALMCVFGKLRMTTEACKMFEHLVRLGVKPNAATYSLLVDAHLVIRDSKAALLVIDDMVEAGFTPEETLKKVQRCCSHELDFDSDERVQSLARRSKYKMDGELLREMLYNLEYSTDY